MKLIDRLYSTMQSGTDHPNTQDLGRHLHNTVYMYKLFLDGTTTEENLFGELLHL